ncbi:MAG: hypothetical protein JNG90_04770, partial [Planctomycetaceae bacterium]|nr:hypothetical protein [Planctomycetaceae bacterium]
MARPRALSALLFACCWLWLAVVAGAQPPAAPAPAAEAPPANAGQPASPAAETDPPAAAQPAAPPAPSEAPPAGAPVDSKEAAAKLSLEQEQIAERYRKFEELLLRMAELTAAEDPTRAALLRQTVARSKERLVGMQFERIIELLGGDRLTGAVNNQNDVVQDLKGLLDLLLSEDRAERLKSEQERIRGYLKEVNKLIKDQQGVQAQTSRGGQTDPLAQRQGKLAERTEQLGKQMSDDEAQAQGESPDGKKPESEREGDAQQGQPADGKPSEGKPGEGQPAEGKPGEGESGAEKPGDDKPKDDKPKDDASKSGDEKGTDEKPSDEGKPESSESGKPGEPSDAKPSESSGKPGQQGGESPPGSPGEGESEPGESGPQQPPPPESDAQKRVAAAQQRMKDAQEKLEKALREEAVEKQEEALRELEAAKAELEKILRQMREEEMARILAMLEARFRKMLELQVEVYEGTIRLDRLPAESRGRGSEIEASRLAKSEAQIALEADKALTLLREEGTAVAMPEALEQTRDDMRSVAAKLAEFDVAAITQGLEEDIIASLEEMIAALEKAQQDLEAQQSQ